MYATFSPFSAPPTCPSSRERLVDFALRKSVKKRAKRGKKGRNSLKIQNNAKRHSFTSQKQMPREDIITFPLAGVGGGEARGGAGVCGGGLWWGKGEGVFVGIEREKEDSVCGCGGEGM